MREIREVDESELEALLRITTQAFPGMKVITPEDRERQLEHLRAIRREPIVHFFAVYEEGEMVGVMRTYDFTMKLRSVRTLVGGVGGVAVDLRHKKRGVAADMIRHFLMYYREQGAAMTALYPFRPDFYKRMGFGYGHKMNRYSFRPDALPATLTRTAVDFLNADDKQAVYACYDRLLERTNGLIELPPHVLRSLFTDPSLKLIGVRDGDQLRGYMIYRQVPIRDDNFLLNDLHVRALVCDDLEAQTALLAFLRVQADQVGRIIYETQDDTFHFLLSDPRNGTGNMLAGLWHETNTQGAGVMYRVIDVPRLMEVLRDHDFGGVTMRLRLDLTDTFLPVNAGKYMIDFAEGRAHLVHQDGTDLEVSMDVAEFSSLITGAIDFRRLHDYGLVTVSDESQSPLLDRLFHAEHRPWCMTIF